MQCFLIACALKISECVKKRYFFVICGFKKVSTIKLKIVFVATFINFGLVSRIPKFDHYVLKEIVFKKKQITQNLDVFTKE